MAAHSIPVIIMVLLKAHLSLSLGEGKVGFFSAIFFKSPPFSLARRGKGGLFCCNFFQKPTFPLSLGEREGGLFCCNFFQRLSINSGTQNSPWVEKTEEKSPVEFRVTVPDLSSPERIQDGRHARAETNNSKGSPWVEKMEEKSPVEFRLTVPDL